MAGVFSRSTSAPVAASTTTIHVSRVSSRTNAMRDPSGDHAGRASISVPEVSRRAEPSTRSITQIQPCEAKASRVPSGDGAGSMGPFVSVGIS